MTLSTSETRSRNWACPEVTSSPTKVLGEGRQKWRQQGHEPQPVRTYAIHAGGRGGDRKQSGQPWALAPSPGCLACPPSELALSSVPKPSFPSSNHTSLLLPAGSRPLRNSFICPCHVSTTPKLLQPCSPASHCSRVWTVSLGDGALGHHLPSPQLSGMLSSSLKTLFSQTPSRSQ